MMVRINRLDKLIGSIWISKDNPERPTVVVCCPPWAVDCPPRAAHRGQVEDFGSKCTDLYSTTTREICLSIFKKPC